LTSNINSVDKTPYRLQLRKLPEVFTLAETRRVIGYNTATAHVTLSRWMKNGLIEALAPRSGVYFNLEKNPMARSTHLHLAITKKYPVLRIVGSHVLATYGWTTQIQRYLSLAVNMPPIKGGTSIKKGYLDIPEVELDYRIKKWWIAALGNQCERDKKNTHIQGFETVSPGFALVDMWQRREKSWFPDHDDLYLDQPGVATQIWEACVALGEDPYPLFKAINLNPPDTPCIPEMNMSC